MSGGAGSNVLTVDNSTSTTRLTTSFGGSSLAIRVNAAGSDQFSLTGTALTLGTATPLSITNTTASTSTTTGSLVNAGGFGNAGNAYFGGSLNLNNGGILFQMDGTTLSGNMAMWFRQASPSANNYGLIGGISSTYLNVATGGTVGIRIGNGDVLTASGSTITTDSAWSMSVSGTTSASSSTTGVFRVGNGTAATNVGIGGGNIVAGAQIRSTSATGGIGYATGAGGAVTQGTSRTTGVTLNNVCGAITLFTAAGSVTWQSFTVTNSTVAATDTIIVNQRSGTDLYMMSVTAVGAGSFRISFATTGGTTSEAPVINFSVIKAVSS
jgi:hypothetical protein